MSKKSKFKPLDPLLVVECTGFGITLAQVVDPDGEVWYNSIVDLEMRSGKKTSHFNSIITQFSDKCPHCCAIQTLMMATMFSDEYFDKISVYSEDGKEIEVDERLFISKLYEELHEEAEFSKKERVLH